jgi:hypothetical protein
VSAKAGTERATRRGKALRAVKPISFDEEVAEAVLVVSRGFGRAASRQGASEARSSSSRAVDKAVAKGHRLRVSSIGKPNQEQPVPAPASEDDGRVVEFAEAGSATSRAQPLESSGGALAPADVKGSVNNVLFHLESRTVRAGARVVKSLQLQKSVRRIFPVRSRRVERRARSGGVA